MKYTDLKLPVFAIVLLLTGILCDSCSISYKFNGSSIDYTKIKTISISDFPNNATLVYPPLAQNFNEALKDIFAKRTRLQPVKRNGDMQIEGEITDYRLTSLGVRADAYAAQTQLTLTIKVRFSNTKNPKDDFESSFSSSQTFDSSKMLTEVQDALLEVMLKELVENIYNQSVARW
jgi:hypothetical protein